MLAFMAAAAFAKTLALNSIFYALKGFYNIRTLGKLHVRPQARGSARRLSIDSRGRGG